MTMRLLQVEDGKIEVLVWKDVVRGVGTNLVTTMHRSCQCIVVTSQRAGLEASVFFAVSGSKSWTLSLVGDAFNMLDFF